MDPKSIGITIFIILFLVNNSLAQEINQGNGLEVSNPEKLHIAIDDLGQDASRIGLTESRIRTKIELRLRQNNIDIVPKDEFLKGDYDYFFYVSAVVIDNAYSFVLRFTRWTTYRANGSTYQNFAISWIEGGTGQHGGDSEYIIDHIDQTLDSFLNDYLTVNDL